MFPAYNGIFYILRVAQQCFTNFVMVIEWLRFQVLLELREAFIKKDEEVWTARVSQIKGYLGKEVWIDPASSDIVLVIRWESIDAWQSVPKSEIARLDKLMGDLAFPVAESCMYQVRKFSH
jgi:uncharacterized protein (TIGR03792 family)